jgi:ectoine hydroxylase-related dioxygenase (phytanoyl-CoA dioxygenase family)
MNDEPTLPGGTSLDDALATLSDDGFVVLREICSAGLVDQILDVSQRRSHEIQEALGTRDIGIGSAAGFIEVVQRSPGRWDIPISPSEFGVEDPSLPWWPLVTAALGDDAEHSFSGVVYSEPGSPAQFWHIDSPHTTAEHRPPHALNVLVALHDIPMAMGPTEFARGSQRLTNHLANTMLASDELIYQHETTSPSRLVEGTHHAVPAAASTALTAGSCLVFDDRILHRGLANEASARRSVAYFSYRQAGYRENTHFESQRSVYGHGN